MANVLSLVKHGTEVSKNHRANIYGSVNILGSVMSLLLGGTHLILIITLQGYWRQFLLTFYKGGN